MFYPTFIFHTPYINKEQLFLLIKKKYNKKENWKVGFPLWYEAIGFGGK